MMNRPFVLALIIPTLFASACAMQNQSYISNEPLQVQDESVLHEMSSNNVTRGDLNYIADDINRRATGDVSITVHYMMKKPFKATQQVADAQGARIKAYLKQQNVRRHVLVLAEPDQDDGVNRIAIAYPALKAKGPANCMDITHADADRFSHGSDSGYYYGCTSDRYLSEMIARPGDLLGNDTMTNAESQRLGKSFDTYRAGERITAESDEGVSASDVYTSE